jgi:lysophospholipase L1-like esterase
MRQVAKEEKLKFVDLFNKLPKEYVNTLGDGVHPDTQGHQMIFNLVSKAIK